MNIRTDLAKELHDDYMKTYSLAHTGEPDGIRYEQSRREDNTVTCITIENSAGEAIIGKPAGNYTTVSLGEKWQSSFDGFKSCAVLLSEVISGMLRDKISVLVAGLGNENITADSVGPFAAQRVIATHHISKMDNGANEVFGDVSVISPGVLAQTGIEAKDQIKAAVDRVRPGQLIVIDSLAAKGIDTLSSTVQVTDTGISPGSGVGNDRGEISERTMGVPVVAIGVPTVVDALTLLHSAYPDVAFPDKENSKLKGCYVCRNDSDKTVREVGKLIGYAIDLIYHRSISFEEMIYI